MIAPAVASINHGCHQLTMVFHPLIHLLSSINHSINHFHSTLTTPWLPPGRVAMAQAAGALSRHDPSRQRRRECRLLMAVPGTTPTPLGE